jgi:hypothetical protein
MKVKSLKLYDYDFGNQWQDEVVDHWDYSDMKKNEAWRKQWISFDCAYYNKDDDRVYLGITSFDADIFRAYDRKTGEFIDLGYSEVANPFDAKFHRSLVKGNDGCLYAAIALLHCPDHYFDAPGSPIIKFDPKSGTITKMTIPIPHVYIQSIDIDKERDMLYGQCLGPEYAFSFDLKTGKSETIGLLGSGYARLAQGENTVVDNSGCAWFNWSLTRAWQDDPEIGVVRLCKYDPEAGKMIYFQKGLPYPDGRHGTVKGKSFHCFDDEYVYASGENGAFYRINPETGDAKFLFNPIPDRPSRLDSLVIGSDGLAYGVAGKQGKCELVRIDYRNDSYELLGEIKDENGVNMWQCHDIVYAGDNTFYACENDNTSRSSYLWEISL